MLMYGLVLKGSLTGKIINKSSSKMKVPETNLTIMGAQGLAFSDSVSI
jgi:hypothetical protein